MGKRRTLSDMRMGYDMYERHQAVGTLLDANLAGSVLDVGGLSGGLSRFHAEGSGRGAQRRRHGGHEL